METFLDRLHAGARAIGPLRRLAIISRILLALAFIPTGMVKLLGHRFTLMSPDTAVGGFFEAMYQTGFYWNFLGLAQVMAGVLLLVPWTTALGAVVTFPLVLNIFLITLSIGFRGTPFVTGGMLLAATFLVCWDYHRLKAIIWPGAAPDVAGAGGMDSPEAPAIGRLEMAGYVMGTACGLGVFAALRSLIPSETVVPLLVGGAAAGLMVLAAWIREAAARALSPTPTLPPSSSLWREASLCGCGRYGSRIPTGPSVRAGLAPPGPCPRRVMSPPCRGPFTGSVSSRPVLSSPSRPETRHPRSRSPHDAFHQVAVPHRRRPHGRHPGLRLRAR